ncbi:MAG TPA: hypothetical protein VGO62_16095 [Myxococcota bacterium]|jgi:hypothetical protein
MTRILVLFALLGLTACSAIKRDAACVAAEKCDDALQTPFGSFAANDPVFGDDINGKGNEEGNFGNVGTCWQNAATAKPCIDQCKAFTQEQHDIAVQSGLQDVADACPGKDAAAAGEGEGEGA